MSLLYLVSGTVEYTERGVQGGKEILRFFFSAFDAFHFTAEMTCNPFQTELTSHTKANNLFETVSLEVDRLSRPCPFCERRLSSEVAGTRAICGWQDKRRDDMQRRENYLYVGMDLHKDTHTAVLVNPGG